MPGTKKQIPFTGLWQKLHASPAAKAWGNVRGREVLELLCSALWHLELAAEMDGGFSTKYMQELFRGTHTPWEEWLHSRPYLSIQSPGCQLILQYIFNTFPDARFNSLIQTALLADGALRLYGAQDVLRAELKKKGPLLAKLPTVLADCKSILKATGEFRTSPSSFNSQEQILKSVIIVTAFRDSIVHGEKYSKKSDPIRVFRQKWINNDFKPNRITYSPAVIGRACKEVFEKLVSSLRYL